MNRRELIKYAPTFLVGLLSSKTLIQSVQEQEQEFIKIAVDSNAGAYAWVAIEKDCLEKAQKGEEASIQTITFTFNENKKHFFSKFGINLNEGVSNDQK